MRLVLKMGFPYSNSTDKTVPYLVFDAKHNAELGGIEGKFVVLSHDATKLQAFGLKSTGIFLYSAIVEQMTIG